MLTYKQEWHQRTQHWLLCSHSRGEVWTQPPWSALTPVAQCWNYNLRFLTRRAVSAVGYHSYRGQRRYKSPPIWYGRRQRQKLIQQNPVVPARMVRAKDLVCHQAKSLPGNWITIIYFQWKKELDTVNPTYAFRVQAYSLRTAVMGIYMATTVTVVRGK